MVTTADMKVLVIEDDADVRDGISQVLSEENIHVDAVSTGDEGLYRAREWEYDLVILDVMLPGMDGWKVLAGLRKTKKTPVLMLTALGRLDDRVRGLDAGADDYLSKPYSDRELLARVRALTRRATGFYDRIRQFGRVAIDVEARQISLDGEPVDFTASQYQIVEYMTARAGRVVSRLELSDALGSGDDSFSNVLEVQIHRIRKRLGRDFIVTRRGHGYVMPLPSATSC